MKKFKLVSIVLVSFMASSFLVACSSEKEGSKENTTAIEETKDTTEQKGEKSKLFMPSEFKEVYSNSEKYKNKEVEFYGRVFFGIEKEGEYTFMQLYTNEAGDDDNVIVKIKDNTIDLEDDDVVRVKGIVKGKRTGKNVFGGEVTALEIEGSNIEKVSYSEAFAPALKTIEVNQEINQHGYKMTLQKVELAKKEARAYLKIENATNENLSFYSFNAVGIQGQQQIKQEDNFGAKYPEIASEIRPNIIEEGIITFKPIDVEGGDFKLEFEGSSDNYDLSFEPFSFDVINK